MLIEAFEEYIDIVDTFENRNRTLDAYVESTMRDLDVFYDEAELKVIKESGTEDDLNYLYTEAEGGVIEKIKKAVQAVIKAFVEFIKNLKSKVIRLVTSAETKLVLNKVEKKVKLNPFLARKKVKVIDKKKPLKVIAKYKSKADSHIAKINSGVFKEKEITAIHNEKSSFDNDYKAAIAGTAALVTTTVAKLIVNINSEVSSLPDHIDSIDKETSSVVDKLIGALDKQEAVAVQAAYTTCANFRTKLGEKEASEHVDAIMYKLKVLKSEVLKGGGDVNDRKTQAKPVKESADFDDILDGFDENLDEFDESVEEDYDGFSADDLLDELDDILD